MKSCFIMKNDEAIEVCFSLTATDWFQLLKSFVEKKNPQVMYLITVK